MKKKEVIAAVAFNDVPVDLQVEGEQEIDGITMQPMTPGNNALAMGAMLKGLLENALSDVHDDDELTPQDFDVLHNALTQFRQDTMNAMMIPEALEQAAGDFDRKEAKLRELRSA